MSNIEKIDKNFNVKTNIEKDNIVFYNAKNQIFRLYGVEFSDGKYRRMPEETAKSVSEGVYALHTNTAGGRLRFITDSSYIGINATFASVGKMPHFALTGSAGFDIYTDEYDGRGEVYAGTAIPPYNVSDKYESCIELSSNKLRTITINFPLYSSVTELNIGLDADAVIQRAPDYTLEKPIVYYGSSITQGGCASKPGSSYQSIISRRFDANYINLGFSGNARAEDEMTEYISNLDMSIFVLDYDHNAPTVEHLRATHEKTFKAIRAKHPTLPVIMLPRPKYYLTEDEIIRHNIVETTYKNAVNSGDKNVYFIDHLTLTGEDIKENGTVDNCHPTDSGFFAMARAVGNVIEEILNKK